MIKPYSVICLIFLSAFFYTATAESTERFCLGNVIYSLSGSEASVIGLFDSTNTELVIPQTIDINGDCYTVTSVADNAFFKCGNLFRVVLPETINVIGSLSFAFCSNLRYISFSSTIETICTDAFYRCDSLPIEDHIRYAGCFLVNVADCDARELFIREGCRFIGDNAFSECKELISVHIPESVKVIGNFAFAGCASLKDLFIPESVEMICFSAFAMCSSLEILQLPANVESYTYDILIDCNNLKRLYVKSQNPPAIKDANKSHRPAIDYFYRFNSDRCILIVPRGSKKLYLRASGWCKFKKIISRNPDKY